MSYSHLLHLKPLLMVLTAAAGTVTGGVMTYTYNNSLARATGSFLVALDPSTMMLAQNASSSSAITVTSLNGYSGTVTLSTYFESQKFTASISPTTVTVPANGAAKSTMSLTAPSTVGNYSVIVTGISSSHGKITYSATMLTLQVESSKDFTITASPTSITLATGATTAITVTVTSTNSYTGNISLTVTAPFAHLTVTGAQSPLGITSGGSASSSLTITAGANTPLGTYTITVTGTSGSRSHSAMISLKVIDPVVEGLSLNSFNLVNITSLNLMLLNIGNGTVTLDSYIVHDALGNSWTLTSWTGPVIPVAAVGTANILIGTSCPTCIYTGIPGQFFQFTLRQVYTVTVTTTRNNQFTFTAVA